MQNRGITVTHYLVKGNPEGVIFAYLSNWTGQAIKIPRNLFSEAKDRVEMNRPGVYFLLGQNDENPDDKIVYVGEANNLSERIIQHLKDKDKSGIEVIIAFSSISENLTVSHTKYLESKIISIISNRTEYRLLNKKEGNSINLPQMVQDEMDTYLDNMKVLFPTLGYNLLEVKPPKNQRPEQLHLDMSNLKASAQLTSNGIEVLKDSQFSPNSNPSLSGSYANLRETLKEKGIVKSYGNGYVFIENYEFPSPSTAAAIILGYAVNGRVAWKNKKGVTLKELEEEKLKNSIVS